MTDMRILQTYDEMQQLVETAAYDVLSPPPEDMDEPGEKWAAKTARAIAEAAMRHVDAS